MNEFKALDPIQYIALMDIGPGSQPEDDVLEYISMPQGMSTHSSPLLPEPEALAEHPDTRLVLQALLEKLRLSARGQFTTPVDISGYSAADRVLLGQLLGEGEVSIRLDGVESLRIQESIFTGVWRVIGEGQDRIEVGPAPMDLALRALSASQPLPLELPDSLPQGVMNAPAIMTEIQDRALNWRSGAGPHVINLTLLPLSEQDVFWLNDCLGIGPVMALTRGYGNCRISSTQIPNCWRLTYFNSQDAMILDTIEITDLPEVICAAPEDLSDSLERFEDVIQWFEGN